MPNKIISSDTDAEQTLNRRAVLAAAGGCSLTLLAGCSDDNGNDDSEDGGDGDDTDNGGDGSNEIQDPVAELDNCPPESVSESFELMPDEPDGFEQFSESDAFDEEKRDFRHVDSGAHFRIQIERRDSEEAAAGASIITGPGKGIKVGDEADYNPELGLLAHVEHAVLRIWGELADDTDLVDALFGEVQCFTEDAVIERTWE